MRLIRNLIPVAFALFGLLFILTGCEMDSPTDPANRAPTQPVIDGPSGTPSHGSTITTLTPTLRWMCSDPDGDLLTYGVRLDTTSPPKPVAAGLRTTSFSPETLQFATKYYWQVIAMDPSGVMASSDIWAYTTPAQPPHLELGESELSFSAVQGDPIPEGQTITISNTGGGLLSWSVSDGGSSWLDQDESSGSSNSATITVSVNTTSLNPGLYDAIITVSSSNADNSPQTITVSYLVMESAPRIALSHSEIDFSVIQGFPIPGSQTFAITNMGGGTLDFSISDGGAAWLDEAPSSGSSNNQIVTVSVNTTNLTPGLYGATIEVSSSNADNSPQTIAVTYRVSEHLPHIALDETELTFNAVQGGSLPTSQVFTISNTGGGLLNWSISDDDIDWLDESPLVGSSNRELIMVSVNTTSLSPGQYDATITVASSNADNNSRSITVMYTVAPHPPHLDISETVLTFSAVQDAPLPTSQSFTISNTGGGTLDWSISDGDIDWLDESPLVGSSNSETITVSVNATDLSPGQHDATITVSSDNADNSPQTIAVTYIVAPHIPHIVLSETAIEFSALQDAPLPASKTFTITNGGGGTLDWSVSDGGISWLNQSPLVGSSNSELITVSVNTTNMSPGEHYATITVLSGNADNTPQTIAVTFTVSESPAQIELSETELVFLAIHNGSLPGSQTFTISNAGGGVLDWSVSDGEVAWLEEIPLADTSNNQLVTVTINRTDLSPDQYDAIISVSSDNADNSPQTIEVSYTVEEPTPRIFLSEEKLTFTAIQGDDLPASQTFTITNSGSGVLNWNVFDGGATWLNESPAAGNSNSQESTVAVNTTDLSPGQYIATLTISSSNADNSPQTIEATFTVAAETP